MSRDASGRRALRGAGLIEALVAFALLAIAVLAAVRIQAAWRLAEDQAQLHRGVVLALHNQIEPWLSGAPALAPASRQLGSMASRVSITSVATAQALDPHAIVDWTWVLRSRDEPEHAGTLRTHRFVLPTPVMAAWASSQGRVALDGWAPGQRQAAMDAGFGLPERTPATTPHAGDRLPRPVREVDAFHAAAGRGTGPLCESPDLDAVLRGRAAASGCDPRRHATRAGVIQWSGEVLRDAQLNSDRTAWLALVIRPPSERIHWREVGDPQCAVDPVTLAPGTGLQEPITAWRCLGSAWTPASAADVATAIPSDDPTGLSLRIADRAIDPLRGLPAGLRACRYPRGEVDARDALAAFTPGAATAAIWQHERIHWWVGPATSACPQGTTAVRRTEHAAAT